MGAGAQDGTDGAQGEDEEDDEDGLVGGFARAFDLISSEYGWSDEQILDTPVTRLRQVVAAIYRRQKWALRARGALVEWQTKALASVIAATVPIAQGKKNPLMDYALGLSLYDGEGSARPAGLTPPPEADPAAVEAYGFDPEHPTIREPEAGSFERAVTQLGGPASR